MVCRMVNSMDMVITAYKDNIVTATIDKEHNNELISVDISSLDHNNAKVGNIYIGRVKNIVKNINAAFVEIANKELCFLQFGSKEEMKNYHNEMDIPVQVLREKIKTKQAAVTTDIILTGKYLIKTNKNEISVSSKIKNKHRKAELISLLSQCTGEKKGYIIRTNAKDASNEDIKAEYEYLEKKYEKILKKISYSPTYSLLDEAPDNFITSVRDSYDSDVTKIITDRREIYDKLLQYFNEVSPVTAGKVVYYEDESYSLDALYGISSKISKALGKRVWLDSGAYLVIEPTEACVIIDVNTGKAVKKSGDKEKTFFDINMEAAKECFRQIKLRNYSGVILIDFVDMEKEENKGKLMNYINELAAMDSVKTSVVDITGLGFVEITRKKVKKPLHESISFNE